MGYGNSQQNYQNEEKEMIYIAIIIIIFAFVVYKLFFGPVSYCPYCYHDIRLKGRMVVTCRRCGNSVELVNDGIYRYDKNKNILIFEDAHFSSPILLLTPPNRIEVPQDISFPAKILTIADNLDMNLFTLSTQIMLGNHTFFPKIIPINGRIKYVIDGIEEKMLPLVPYKRYSFYIGYSA
jgi:hypothetical protein